MGYDDVVIRIERLANGWEVECYEPGPRPKGKDGQMPVSVDSGWAGYAFVDRPNKPAIDEVVEFIRKKLPELERNAAEEYNRAFDEAAEEDD